MTDTLMYVQLNYEEPAHEDRKPSDVPPLLNALMCEAELALGTECPNPATREFVMIDEADRAAGEGFVYTTYRCDLHPEIDPDYHEREL